MFYEKIGVLMNFYFHKRIIIQTTSNYAKANTNET
jgi:hypothetical protein